MQQTHLKAEAEAAAKAGGGEQAEQQLSAVARVRATFKSQVWDP